MQRGAFRFSRSPLFVGDRRSQAVVMTQARRRSYRAEHRRPGSPRAYAGSSSRRSSRVSSSRVGSRNPTLNRKSPVTTARPLPLYGAIEGRACSDQLHHQRGHDPGIMSASLIGRLGSSAFRLSIATVSMSLAGSCFSSESAPGPFQHGIRERGGTISTAALLSYRQQVQADIRTHLIHRPARDIIPPLGGARMSSYPV